MILLPSLRNFNKRCHARDDVAGSADPVVFAVPADLQRSRVRETVSALPGHDLDGLAYWPC